MLVQLCTYHINYGKKVHNEGSTGCTISKVPKSDTQLLFSPGVDSTSDSGLEWTMVNIDYSMANYSMKKPTQI